MSWMRSARTQDIENEAPSPHVPCRSPWHELVCQRQFRAETARLKGFTPSPGGGDPFVDRTRDVRAPGASTTLNTIMPISSSQC
jgi:hypothetical protein